MHRAIDVAHKAQACWVKKTGKERAAVLRKLYGLMLANVDDLAAILTMEMGKPLSEARGEILYGASYMEWFGEEAKRVYGDTISGIRRTSVSSFSSSRLGSSLRSHLGTFQTQCSPASWRRPLPPGVP